MDEQILTSAKAAQRSATAITDAVAQVMSESDDLARAAAFEEAQETILALIAAVIAADGATTYHEFIFASLITKDLRDPMRCRAYLTDCAARWTTISQTTPRFLTEVIRYDEKNSSSLCREILEELKNLVHYTAAVDGEISHLEMRVAEGLIARADACFRQARWSVKWEEHSLPAFPISASLKREEFGNREIV
jgi:hypothetical protein